MVRVSNSESDGLYSKYRVFREPDTDMTGRPVETHPVPLAGGPVFLTGSVESHYATELYEVEDFLFVLKPDSDPHARVALVAYAWSVRGENPELWSDLMQVLSEM